MGATAARPRRGGVPTALVVGLVIGGVIGLFLGLAWRASEGADCGPIGGLDELLMQGVISLVAVVMLVIAGLVAFLGRRRAASGCFAALGGFAIAVLIGHSLGMPLNSCGYAGPEPQTEPATLTL